MLPAFTTATHSNEKRLSELIRQLGADEQVTLLRFAEFLAANPPQTQPQPTTFPNPEPIRRPEDESVIKAIKRLTTTYPMINKDDLLHKTSDLVAGHVMNGRAAVDVIDDLEKTFSKHYQQLKYEFEQNR